MRPRRLYLALMALALVAAVVTGKRLFLPAVLPLAAPISSPLTQTYLVILGVGGKQNVTWNGSITATGGTIVSLEGWRFTNADSISGTSSWKLGARATAGPPGAAGASLQQENGVIVTIANPTGTVTFNVTTTQGNFSFTSQDVSFGVSKSFLAGRALVMQTAAPLQLTASEEEEDFPVTAQSGDDFYLVYTQFVHGDR